MPINYNEMLPRPKYVCVYTYICKLDEYIQKRKECQRYKPAMKALNAALICVVAQR